MVLLWAGRRLRRPSVDSRACDLTVVGWIVK